MTEMRASPEREGCRSRVLVISELPQLDARWVRTVWNLDKEHE